MATNDDFVACACCGKNSEKECKFCGTPFCCDACYDKSKESHEAVCSELYTEGLVATYLDTEMLGFGGIQQLFPKNFEKYSGIVQQFYNNNVYVFGIQSAALLSAGEKSKGLKGLFRKTAWLKARTYHANYDKAILSGVKFDPKDPGASFAEPKKTVEDKATKTVTGSVYAVIVIGTSAGVLYGTEKTGRNYDTSYESGLLSIQKNFRDIIAKIKVGKDTKEILYPGNAPIVVRWHKCPT